MTGEEWVYRYCQENNIGWETLSMAEQFQLSMLIPCTIRCFRVGVSVSPLKSGEKCPECGKPHKDDLGIRTKYSTIREANL